MTPSDRRRVEKAARDAGWTQNSAHSNASYPYQDYRGEWYWDVWNGASLTTLTKPEIYLLAARLLNVRLSKGGKKV